jgi:hypothetical protein
VVPFDLSLTFLIVGGALIRTLWVDNFAPQPLVAKAQPAWSLYHPARLLAASTPLGSAWERLLHDPLMLLIMAVSACIESAMYALVLSLSPSWPPPCGSRLSRVHALASSAVLTSPAP